MEQRRDPMQVQSVHETIRTHFLGVNAEERIRGHFDRWLANPSFKAALHQHDDVPRQNVEKDYGI